MFMTAAPGLRQYLQAASPDRPQLYNTPRFAGARCPRTAWHGPALASAPPIAALHPAPNHLHHHMAISPCVLASTARPGAPLPSVRPPTARAQLARNKRPPPSTRPVGS